MERRYAAGCFGVVQRVVCSLDDGLEVFEWLAQGNTDTDRDMWVGRVGDGDGGADPFTDGTRRRGVDAGEQYEEFLAAEAYGDVSRAQQRCDGPSNVLQDEITDGMAVGVVDVFEVVDVDHEGRGDRGCVAAVVDRAEPAGGVGEIEPVV